MKIFVVDDDPNVVDLLPIILANEGFDDVHCFLSPAQGLAALKKPHSAFECLILDIDMPGMDGITLCEHVRALRDYRDVPIIMLTALRDEKTVRAAIRAGANDYITKPFDVLEIGVRVRMAAKIVDVQAPPNHRHGSERRHASAQKATRALVTREEIMNMFSDELYRSKVR